MDEIYGRTRVPSRWDLCLFSYIISQQSGSLSSKVTLPRQTKMRSYAATYGSCYTSNPWSRSKKSYDKNSGIKLQSDSWTKYKIDLTQIFCHMCIYLFSCSTYIGNVWCVWCVFSSLASARSMIFCGSVSFFLFNFLFLSPLSFFSYEVLFSLDNPAPPPNKMLKYQKRNKSNNSIFFCLFMLLNTAQKPGVALSSYHIQT